MAKILLVEDDNNLREIFELRLQADGNKTISAGDGEAALELAMKEKPDLIICDVMMPRMSGFEMLETLRKAPELTQTKVIMMTALGQAEDQARGAKLGVIKYLVKSQVTLEDFARVVREALGVNKTTEASQANNNKVESENAMDDPSSNNSGMPTPPADGSGGSDPMSGQQSAADEQKDVDTQVAGAMGDSGAASSDPAAPADPVGGGDGGSDAPVPPPTTDPAAPSGV